MNKIAIALGLAASLLATAAAAQQGRTLEQFVVEANRVPLNPTAVFSPTARRLGNEARAGFRQIVAELDADRAAGRTSFACPPQGKLEINPRQLRDFLNTIPRAQRQRMTVADGLRAWMANRHPCRS